MRLTDFVDASIRHSTGRLGLPTFLAEPTTQALEWPEDVKEQWLFDHAGTQHFEPDYGHIELEQLTWEHTTLPLEEFLTMPTGKHDAGYLEEVAKDPQHWIERRNSGIHAGVRESWSERGTWIRPPLVIAREVVADGASGWQLIEGRTRVGVLRGLHRQGIPVALDHDVWVGTLK